MTNQPHDVSALSVCPLKLIVQFSTNRWKINNQPPPPSSSAKSSDWRRGGGEEQEEEHLNLIHLIPNRLTHPKLAEWSYK